MMKMKIGGKPPLTDAHGVKWIVVNGVYQPIGQEKSV
jgi:hypothetical protein